MQASAGPAFLTMTDVTIFTAHNSMNFYTWGDGQCCLPAGATDATLEGTFPDLKAGDVLIFEEVMGPLTGDKADADPTHKWAVRLTEARTTDLSGNALVDPWDQTALTHIEWQVADALPFPVCLSAVMSFCNAVCTAS